MSTIRSTGIKPSRRKANPSRRREPVAPSNPVPLASHEDSEREAWVRNSARLAKFICEHFTNRDDAYGRYVALDARSGKNKARTIHEGATEEVVIQHFRATDRGDIIGFHATSKQNTCRWLVLDIDQHGDPNPEAELRNEKAVFDFASMLSDFGAKPLVMKSNGRGGFHIWVIFDKPVPSAHIYYLGKDLVQHWKELGIDEPEVFPKQPQLEDGKLGNWVRLPGLHHTYDFYTQVWDGETWLNGQDAIDHILSAKPCPSELVPIRQDILCRQLNHREKQGNPEQIEVWRQRLQTHYCRHYLSKHRLQTLAELLSKLDRVTESGEGWSACCPAHLDRRPSLSVNFDKSEGRFLLKCHRDCKFDDIVHEAGMTMNEMFDTALSTRSAIQPPRRGSGFIPQVTESVPALGDRQAIYTHSANDARVGDLANQLNVSPESLRAIGIGWCVTDNCWTFPEYNGKGEICGILRRYRTGNKYTMTGSHRGLTLPQGWKESGEPLYICEGQSDVAAAISKGMRAIGRPGISAGLGDLATLLRQESGKLIMVADNDRHDKNRSKAKELASKLAHTLQRSVKLIAPPSGYKDLREFLTEGQSCC